MAISSSSSKLIAKKHVDEKLPPAPFLSPQPDRKQRVDREPVQEFCRIPEALHQEWLPRALGGVLSGASINGVVGVQRRITTTQ